LQNNSVSWLTHTESCSPTEQINYFYVWIRHGVRILLGSRHISSTFQHYLMSLTSNSSCRNREAN
jgi:hypothetical protein